MVLSTILISHRDSTQATPRGELNVSIAFGMLEIILIIAQLNGVFLKV